MHRYFDRRLGTSQPKNIDEITLNLTQRIVENLNFIERLRLKISGFLFIDYIRFEGWSGELPFYLFKCSTHGYQLSYPIGHYLNLHCLDCKRKQLDEMPNPSKMIYEKYIKKIIKEDEDNAAIPTITAHK